MKIIDIGQKKVTRREAVVEGKISLKKTVITAIKRKKILKGDVLDAARLAGIMAAKKTSDLIPMCHPIPIEYVEIEIFMEKNNIKVTSTVRGDAKTGVEMEAFSATTTALLTIYDMCKSLDRAMVISGIRLMKKSGGKSGLYERR